MLLTTFVYMIKHPRGQLKEENVYCDSKFLRVQVVVSWSELQKHITDKVLSLHGGQNA